MPDQSNPAAGQLTSSPDPIASVSGAAIGGHHPYEQRRRAFRERLQTTMPGIRGFAAELGQTANWTDIASRTTDPHKRRVATAVSLITHPAGLGDRQRFEHYRTARECLTLLEQARRMLAMPAAVPLTADVATTLAPVIAMGARGKIDAIEGGGGAPQQVDSLRRLLDPVAVKRVLARRGRSAVRKALTAFLPIVLRQFEAAALRVEPPELTKLRREDARIDAALGDVDAVAILIEMYHPPLGGISA